MNKNQLIVVWVACQSILFCISVFAQPLEQNIETSFREADTSFNYNGEPIHPGLVEEFRGWISDKGYPITISVDVAAAYGTNEYSGYDVKITNKGYIYLYEDNTPGYFFYKWLGKLDNGFHVLRVGDSGGGSGIFEELLFVRFDIDEGFTPKGKKYKRLLMSIVRSYNLGDRDDGEITVLPKQNKVIVGESRYRKEAVELRF